MQKSKKDQNKKLPIFENIHNAWDIAFNDLNTLLNKYQISDEDIKRIMEIESGMIVLYREACG